jgi:putative transposase
MSMSRQAYYQGRQRSAERGQRAEEVVQLVKQQRMRQPRLGTRKLHHLLQEPLERMGATLGRDALFDVLRNARMLVPNHRAYHKTTDSRHRFRRHPNLVKEGPEQIRHLMQRAVVGGWADITYLPTADKFGGIQYCSTYYQALHQRHGVTRSMTDGYDCYQNALAERVNGILKNELLQRPADLLQARRMVTESVHIYNHERPHLWLHMDTLSCE